MKAEVELVNLEFYAYHGFYEQEQKIGNRFLVDLHVGFTYEVHTGAENIHHTINYETLYKEVKVEMQTPVKLLETVAEKIMAKIFQNHPNAKEVSISISKLDPPIGGKCERAKVTLRESR